MDLCGASHWSKSTGFVLMFIVYITLWWILYLRGFVMVATYHMDL